MSNEELFEIKKVQVDIPKAHVFPTIKFANCVELVAKNKVRIKDSEIVYIHATIIRTVTISFIVLSGYQN